MKRYSQLARLLVKYGGSDLVKQAGLESAVPSDATRAEEFPKAKELAADLEEMGSTYVKLGQLLSTRPDILPQPALDALARLQDHVEPFPYADVERIVAEELGVRISKAFEDFEERPMAAASLAQVHRARLRTGREVAVKVQRPGIRERVMDDLEVLEDIAETLDRRTEAGRRLRFGEMLDEFRQSLLRELDFRQEARNLETLSANLEEFDRVVVPSPVEDLSTGRVLTMDFVRGRNITGVSPMALMEIEDRHGLAEELFQAYLKQILVDGFFHADPHPGNVFLTDEGDVALIDLGMVARVGPTMQEKLLRLLLAVAEGRGDDVAEVGIEIGDRYPDFDERRFRRAVSELVAEQQNATVAEVDVGRVVLELTRLSGQAGIHLPSELTMLGKTLLNLDQVGRTLDPDFDPNAAIRRHVGEIMRDRMRKQMSPSNIFANLLETNEFVQRLPGRMNKVLDSVANNEVRIEVDAIDEVHLMEGIQKVANRITMGLVLAALIIGAAMLMQVDTDFEILGYPGLAIIFFLTAAAGGVALMADILLHDEKSDKEIARRRRKG
jgi:ubiquinone biosynthesis protein